MTRHRAAWVLAVLMWSVASLPATAWAHPEPMAVTVGRTVVASVAPPLLAEPPLPSATAAPVLPRHAPPRVALAVGVLALLAMLPRRRTLALSLALALTGAALAGASHALLHLGHVAHADTLVLGASVLPPAVDEPAAGARAITLARLGPVVDGYRAPTVATAVRSVQGRSPPAPESS